MSRQPECPICHGTAISVMPTEREVSAGETRLSYSAEYSRCERCGEEFYSRAQVRSASRAAADVLAAFTGRLGPSEIAAIRKKYGVTQKEMQRVLGSGKGTQIRYEAGTVRPSKMAEQLLREIRDSPALFQRLAAIAGVDLGRSDVGVAWRAVADSMLQVKFVTNSPLYANAGPQDIPGLDYKGPAIPGKVGWTEEPPRYGDIVQGASAVREVGSSSPTLY